MQDPFNAAASNRPQAGDSYGLSLMGQYIGDNSGDSPAERLALRMETDNPFTDVMAEDTYFQAIPRLNRLRDEVRATVGLSAGDLIRVLDKIACQASFDPVGAVREGNTADAYFRGHPEFNRLELELARKICPANVSEVLTLVKDTSYYTPTRRIVSVMEVVYRQMLASFRRERNRP